MKFTLQRHTALAALSAVQQAVKSGDIQPILKNVLITAADGILDITASNLDIQVRHTLTDVRIEDEGAITVRADKLRDSVASLSEGADFVFEYMPDQENQTDKRATLRSGRARFTMVTLPASDFPLMGEETGAAGFTLDAAAMLRLLTIGSACAAKGDVRAYINGAFMHVAASGTLRLVSTDTLRMSWADKAGVEGVAGWGGVILPSATIDLVSRLLRNEAPDVATTVDAGPSRVTFGIGRSTVISKVIAGKYVPYERVIPRSVSGEARVDTDLIIGALNRALVMMDSETECVTLHFGENSLGFETRAANTGELAERVDVEFTGEPRRMNVNGSYLRDLLARIRTENVVIRLSTEPHSITLNETGDSDMFSFMAPQHG